MGPREVHDASRTEHPHIAGSLRGSARVAAAGRSSHRPWSMHDDCPACGLDFDRGDPGHFTGAMYVSYALAIPLIALLTLIEHLIIPGWSLSGWSCWPR